MPVPDHFTLIAPFYEHFIRLRAPDTLISLLDLPVSAVACSMLAEALAALPRRCGVW
jgi:hypothetical protein